MRKNKVDLLNKITNNLKSGLKERQLIALNLNSLTPAKKEKDIEDIASLRQNIIAYGLLTALTVIGPDEKGKYVVVNGNRRYYILKDMLKHSENPLIPCYIVEKNTDVNTIQEYCLVANMSNKTNTSALLIEYCKLMLSDVEYMSCHEKADLTKTCACLAGVSARYIRMADYINRTASEEIKNAIKKGEVDLNEATDILRETNKKAGRTQQEYLEAVIDKPEGVASKKVIQAVSLAETPEEKDEMIKTLSVAPKSVSVHEVKEVVAATDDIQKRQDVLNKLAQGHKKTLKIENDDRFIMIQAFMDVLKDRFGIQDKDEVNDILMDVLNRTPLHIQVALVGADGIKED